jgi:hypothetical protein
MNKIQQFFQWLLIPPTIDYIYFRNNKHNYYGLCGTTTTYKKVEYSECEMPTTEYLFIVLKMNRDGFYECTKDEYEKHMRNKEDK